MAEVFRTASTDIITLSQLIDIDLIPDEKNHRWMFWIYASIHKHFDARKGDYNLYIEGDERTYQDETDFVELRIDGPFITQHQKKVFFLDVEVNVLVQSHMDPTDLYKIQRVVGWFTKAFTNTICIYKYGDEDFDSQDLFATLHLKRDIKEKVDINYYGIVKENTRITQSTIEGHYRLDISNLEE